MDPYREPLLVDPSSLSVRTPGRFARWRAALKSATPETAFRLLVVFLLGNVVATSAGTAVSLELQRREAGRLEKRFTSQLASARQDLLEARSDLIRTRAEDRAQAMRLATQNRPAPPGSMGSTAASGMPAMPALPATLDPAMRDVFERAQRQSIFQHLPRREQRALPARQIALRRQTEGTDVSVEDIALSEGVRARASLAWREMMSHPQSYLAGLDRVGAYTVRPQDSTVFRVLGLVPGDVLVSTNGQAWDEAELCSSQCGYLVPDLFDRPGALTLEVLHEGARTVRAFTWKTGGTTPSAPFARAR